MARLLAQETFCGHEPAKAIGIKMYTDGIDDPAKLIDVKKELYRFPAVAVDYMALSSGIIPSTIWNTIEELEKQRVISPSNAHHLTVLTSISAELRLRTYIANGGQRENMSALSPKEVALNGQECPLLTDDEVQTNMLKPVFHLPNEKQLLRYYYTARPLKLVLSKWPEKKGMHLFADFYDKSPSVRGMMYFGLCRYKQAISYFEEALEKAKDTEVEKMSLLDNLAAVWYSLGDYEKAITYIEQAQQTQLSIYREGAVDLRYFRCVASSLNNLGLTLGSLGDERKAISCFEQALQIRRNIYGEEAARPKIASLLNSLGIAWHKLEEYKKALDYFEESLQMQKSIYGPNTAHPEIACSLNSLGGAWGELGDQEKEINHFEQALLMLRRIYGHSNAHPSIATLLNNLGMAWLRVNDHMKATSYCEQAMQMYKRIYGQTTEHPDIAYTQNNLGGIWHIHGDYKRSISYYENAIQMLRNIHGQDTVHLDIACSLDNVGVVWSHLADRRKAISCLENALQMFRSIYGKSKAHDKIAGVLVNLGEACSGFTRGNTKAIRYYEEALQMYRIIYGQTTACAPIASSLFCLERDVLAADLGRRRELHESDNTENPSYGRERKDDHHDMTENITMEVSDTDLIGNSDVKGGKTFEILGMVEKKPPLLQQESTKSTGASAQAGLPCEGDELEELYESRKSAEHTTDCFQVCHTSADDRLTVHVLLQPSSVSWSHIRMVFVEVCAEDSLTTFYQSLLTYEKTQQQKTSESATCHDMPGGFVPLPGDVWGDVPASGTIERDAHSSKRSLKVTVEFESPPGFSQITHKALLLPELLCGSVENTKVDL
ncbi:hypothetical protein Bbelb_193150 [Branchiostoma belcheri]|nr:hypothetical protein Bbelb_193150 [Branchiostoma belcheri]